MVPRHHDGLSPVERVFHALAGDYMGAFLMPGCKGLIFRGKVNEFVTEVRVARHVEVSLLKRQSCPGCEKCGHFLEDARESLGWGSLHLDNIEHGKIYRAKTVIDSTDWESGFADEWHTEFEEVKGAE